MWWRKLRRRRRWRRRGPWAALRRSARPGQVLNAMICNACAPRLACRGARRWWWWCVAKRTSMPVWPRGRFVHSRIFQISDYRSGPGVGVAAFQIRAAASRFPISWLWVNPGNCGGFSISCRGVPIPNFMALGESGKLWRLRRPDFNFQDSGFGITISPLYSQPTGCRGPPPPVLRPPRGRPRPPFPPPPLLPAPPRPAPSPAAAAFSPIARAGRVEGGVEVGGRR